MSPGVPLALAFNVAHIANRACTPQRDTTNANDGILRATGT